MINAFKIAFILLFLITTVFVVVSKPTLHKNVVFGDTNYVVTQPQENSQPIKIQPQEIKTTEQKVQTVKKQQPKVIVQVIEEHIKTQPKVVAPVQQKNIKTVQHVQQTTTSTPAVVNRVVQQTQEKPQPKPVQAEKVTPQEIKTVNIENKPLTEAEEIIAWNKWRSDLQNHVMKDSKISAPVGTTFNFTFTVDEYGNVSNINTWSDNNNYTPTAKRVIKPILLSYQRTTVLKFPARTKRKIVNVQGGFTMSTSTRYSTPGDYHDYERVKR